MVLMVTENSQGERNYHCIHTGHISRDYFPITARSVIFYSFSLIVLFPLKIDLLLQYLKEDPRKAVKKLAIQDLKLLAKKAPHMWSRKNIQVRTFTLSLSVDHKGWIKCV